MLWGGLAVNTAVFEVLGAGLERGKGSLWWLSTLLTTLMGLVVPLRLLCLLDHVDATVGGAVVS